MKYIGIIDVYNICIDDNGNLYSIGIDGESYSEYMKITLRFVDYKDTKNNWIVLFNLFKNYTQDCVR